MRIKRPAFVITLCACVCAMGCRQACTLKLCTDEHSLQIYQNEQTGIEIGPYFVVIYDADIIFVELYFNVVIGYDGKARTVMDEDQIDRIKEQYSGLSWGFQEPGIDKNNRVNIDLAQFLREEDDMFFSTTLDEMKIEVYSEDTLLGSQIFQNEYEWYWCNGDDCAGSRKNYRAESRMVVDSIPAMDE